MTLQLTYLFHAHNAKWHALKALESKVQIGKAANCKV